MVVFKEVDAIIRINWQIGHIGNYTEMLVCPEGSHHFFVEETPDGALAQAKINSFLSRAL